MPLGPTTWLPACRVQHRHLGVDLDRRVIVDRARRSEHAAVSVIGELVQADVRHHQAVVADFLAHRPNGGGQDAVRIERAGPAGILVLGDAEEHDARQTRVGGLHRRLPERVESVLNDPGHGADRAWLPQPFGHEHGQDQLARLEAGLGNHGPHGRLWSAIACGRCLIAHSLSKCGQSQVVEARNLQLAHTILPQTLTGAASSDTAAGAGAALRRLEDRLAGLQEGVSALRGEAGQASARSTTDGLAAMTSTRRPCSSQVRAVAGPMTAMIVEACGFPAMPTRLRTVDEDVNTTASNLPVLIASRTGAGGGVARTVR